MRFQKKVNRLKPLCGRFEWKKSPETGIFLCLGLGCVDIKNMFFVRLVVYENLESDYVYLCIVISCFGIGYML